MRAYGPLEPWFDKAWRPGEVELVNSLRREATVADFMRHEKHVTSSERQRVEARLTLRGVIKFHGAASFVDAHTIRIVGKGGAEEFIYGEKILIATGSSPLRPPEFPFEDDRVHDSNEILELKALPKKLIVIGGGVIGSEYAGTFAALGAEVHLVDGRDTLMPFLDAEISRGLADAMAASGVRFHWKEKVVKCDASQPGDVTLTRPHSAGRRLPARGGMGLQPSRACDRRGPGARRMKLAPNATRARASKPPQAHSRTAPGARPSGRIIVRATSVQPTTTAFRTMKRRKRRAPWHLISGAGARCARLPLT